MLDTATNSLLRYAQDHQIGAAWTVAIVMVAFLLGIGMVYLAARVLLVIFRQTGPSLAWLLRKLDTKGAAVNYSFLQLTFPSDTTKSAYATEQLHILLRGLVKYRGLRERMAARKQPYSLELVATQNDGIRYIIRIPEREVETVRRTLLSFLPGLKIAEVADYIPGSPTLPTRVAELHLSNDYLLPLSSNKALDEHDPIAFVTGQMRSLSAGEMVAFQIVATPVAANTHPDVLRRARDMRRRINLKQDLMSKLKPERVHALELLAWTVFLPVWALWLGLKLLVRCIGMIANNELPDEWKSGVRGSTDAYPEDLGVMIKEKLDQPLFEVSLRVLATSRNETTMRNRLDAVASSFQTFSSPYQSLRTQRNLWPRDMGSTYLRRFVERSLSPHILSWPTIISSSELSDLYHFPNTDTTKTEDLVKSRSRDLPAPLSIKGGDASFDVVVGANKFGGAIHNIGLSLKQRQKHTYIIGKTGTGKTTLLMSSIYQDMVNGKGLAVLDAHGDMSRELLRLVPEHRRDDVVVFDPADRDFPVALNILDPGIEFDSEDDKYEWITSTVISVFAKLADENQWGPRMEHILRNATLTALQTPKPTLYTLQRLLTDKKYQRSVARGLKDPVLKQFWDKEFKMMGSMQMSSVTAPLTHRLGHFITAKMSRHILLQEESTVRIADIMNEGKILLVSLSKGDMGEDQSFFFGTILTSFIWMAAYQRTKIPEDRRRDFFVYVDEFQNFATPQFGAITSEGRKFHVSLIVSHQNIAQMQDKDLVKIVAGNAATIICLKVGPEDEAFILPNMKPEVEKGDIVNLPPYHFYMKVTGDESEDAFSGQTVPLDVSGSAEVADTVVDGSRRRFATQRAKVEEDLKVLLEGAPKEKKAVRAKKPPTPKPAATKATLHGLD